jgi:hypothetical protein
VSGRKTGDRSEKFIDSKEVIRGCSSKDSQNSSLRKRDMKKQITKGRKKKTEKERKEMFRLADFLLEILYTK